jgi:hypothetical protein
MIFSNDQRGRRKKQTSHNTSTPQPVAQNLYTSQSTVQLQQQGYPPPVPPLPPGYARATQSLSPPQHPVYGAVPQFPVHHTELYSSPPLQPVHPYVGNSANVFPTPPRKEKDGMLKSSWHKVDRLAGKSCNDLRGQLASGAGKSVNMLTSNCIDKPHAMLSKKSTQVLNQGAALCDLMSTKLDAVITSIDGERFSGKEKDLMVYDVPQPYAETSNMQSETTQRGPSGHAVHRRSSENSSSEQGSNHFSKVWLYANSRLPPHLPPFKVYMPTFPLLCLAAQYAERVYTPPSPRTSEVETHVPSDWRSGTKAMVLKTVPIDDMNTIVFAIRGSQTFMDWAVNYRSSPKSPAGFLDDEGNLCHAGFLHVARQMIQPVADRLRTLLEENPSRSHCSLLITGHSAGGAVASLLFAHMMSTTVSSDLNYLTGFFKRVHCVTFGAPPTSLLPLKRPIDKRHRKSLFFSFINEGDPVPRADKQTVRSLLKLYASPAPNTPCSSTLASFSKLNLSNTSNATLQTTSSKPNSKPAKFPKLAKTSSNTPSHFSVASIAPSWNIPPCTLSTAGRLVVLRQKPGGRSEDDVEAVTVDEDVLREVVYGDPLKHMMTLYKSRIERLAVRAVTAGGY